MSKTWILSIAINLTDWTITWRIICALQLSSFVNKTFWSSVVTKNLLFLPHTIHFATGSGAETEAEHCNGMWRLKCKVHPKEQPHKHMCYYRCSQRWWDWQTVRLCLFQMASMSEQMEKNHETPLLVQVTILAHGQGHGGQTNEDCQNSRQQVEIKLAHWWLQAGEGSKEVSLLHSLAHSKRLCIFSSRFANVTG